MTDKISRGIAMNIIEQEVLDTSNHKPKSISAISPDKIKTMVSVFQQRELEGNWTDDNLHVEKLMKAIKPSSKKVHMLDPMVIWSSNGAQWYVIDGHHRLLAYRKQKITTQVPVEVFAGTLTEAIAESMQLNSKDRLPMTNDEKMNAAWFLTVLDKMSKKGITESASVSYGTVGTMRKTRRALKAMNNEETGLHYTDTDLLDLNKWKDARDIERGASGSD